MPNAAPPRPALLPALLFASSSLIASTGLPLPASLALGLAATALFAWRRKSVRRFDVGLLLLAWFAGLFGAWYAGGGRADALGDAAFALPIGAPFERSWTGVLQASPKPVDDASWRIRVDALPEGKPPHPQQPLALALEVPVRTDVDRIRLSGLRAGDRIRFWARIRLDPELGRVRTLELARGTIKSPGLIELLARSTVSPRNAFQRYRDRLQRRLRRLYGSHERMTGFLSAVLLGDRSARDPAWESRLRACGLSHLLAISGLHVGIVAAFLLGLARRTLRRPWWRVLVIGGSLCLFGGLVGAATSVQRAVGAATGFLLGRALGREGEPLNRLACLAVAIGLTSPGATGTPAYALSFAASAGILLAISPARERRSRLPRIAQPLQISLAAYLATAPLSALYFGQLAPWAPVANLAALPCLVLVLAGGYASLLCAGIPLLGAASTALTRVGFVGIEHIAETLDERVLSPLFVVEPQPVTCALVIGVGLAAWLARPRAVRATARVVFALAIVWLHVGPPPDDFERPGAVLLDVGQGQALLWYEHGQTTLLDAAGRGYGRWDPGAQIVRPALLTRGVRRLDRLILSHGHADHAAGAFAVIDAFEIGEVWLGPGWWRNRRLADLAAHARRRGAAVRLVSRGDLVAGIRVHAPARVGGTGAGNAGSVVVTLGRDPWTLFVPGDLDGAPLEQLLGNASIPPAQAVILAHHGSRRGTPERLLERLRPRLALVSCGWRNRFRHPHREIVERLHIRRIPLWRTDHHGTIRLRAGPDRWLAEPERGALVSIQETNGEPGKTKHEDQQREGGEP